MTCNLKQVRWGLILFALASIRGQPRQDLDMNGGSHVGLPCSVCHQETAKHGLSSTAARVTPALEVCGRCHAKEVKIFVASQHGTAKQDGPTCTICHGTHRLKTAKQIEQQCLNCHRAPPLFFMNPVPEVSGKVSCMNCHSAHSD